jgi:hypothetical protein
MRTYFNPALMSDLKERVFKTIDALKLQSQREARLYYPKELFRTEKA